MNEEELGIENPDSNFSQKEEVVWLDKFYSNFETNLRNYTRPKDWKERLNKLRSKPRNVVGELKEGRAGGYYAE